MLSLPSNRVLFSTGIVLSLSYVAYRFYRRNDNENRDAVFISA